MSYANLSHCCASIITILSNDHGPINYSPVVREYYLELTTPRIIQLLVYCPWCGAKFPADLQAEYFTTLEQEYGIKPDLEVLKNPRVPEEFKSDAWWRKRGL